MAIVLTANTFFYFFSTTAQCLAAIAALALVAVQMRVSFLDAIVTSAKRVVVASQYGPMQTGPIEHEMALRTASEVLENARAKQNPTQSFTNSCDDALEKAITRAQDHRSEAKNLLRGLVLSMTVPLLELPLSESLGAKETCDIIKFSILIFNAFGLVVVAIFILDALDRVLGIAIKKELKK